jgi:hypothetical protein
MAVIDKLKSLAGRKAPDRPSVAMPADVAPVDEDDLPIPSDIKAVFLGGLFLLAMLAVCYVAAEIVLPIVLAFVFSLALQPAMRALERVHLWCAERRFRGHLPAETAAAAGIGMVAKFDAISKLPVIPIQAA